MLDVNVYFITDINPLYWKKWAVVGVSIIAKPISKDVFSNFITCSGVIQMYLS